MIPAYTLQVATERDLYDYGRFPVKTEPTKGTRYREAYGRKFPGNPSDLDIEMWCAAKRLRVEDGGLGEFFHFKRVIQLLYPYLVHEWHHWLDMQLSCFVGIPGTHTLLGGGGIGKSWSLGTFARLWQACSPTTRGVMIINTTQKSQTERAWKYVIDCQQSFPWLPGHMNESHDNPKLQIPIEIPDPKNPSRMIEVIKPGVGIISQTVKQGSKARATADLKGMHPDELLVIAEESNHLKRSNLERARANWITNKYYQVILTGNPEIDDVKETAREDSLYHFSEPVHGWGTVEWGKTRSWQNKFGGKSFHFDPYDSPRIHAPDKFVLSTWLPDVTYIDNRAKELGGSSSALFNQQIRGIYDHESLPFNPITLSMCRKFDVYRRAKFTGMNRQRWAAFDPAYSGGDEAILKIAESGFTESGRTEIDFLGEETTYVHKIDPKSGDEPSFQMLKWVKRVCELWNVPPENFIIDANIIGIGIGDIISQFWSKKIHKIIVMGPATDRIIDHEKQTKASERYANKQTELWCAVQLLIITGQICGLDQTTVNQLIERPAERLEGGKIKIMSKKDFRKAYGYSPDRAEVVCFIVDLLRDRGSIQPSIAEDDKFGILQAPRSAVVSCADVFVNMGMSGYGESSARGAVDPRLGGIGDSMIELADMTSDVYRWKQSMF